MAKKKENTNKTNKSSNYKDAISRRPMRQPRQVDIGRYASTIGPRGANSFTLGGSSPSQYTGQDFIMRGNTPLQYQQPKVQYYPSTNVLTTSGGTEIIPYKEMVKQNISKPSSNLWSKVKGAGRYLGPAFGLGQAFMGTTPQSKILGLIGGGLMLSPHPLYRGLGMGALTAAGAIDTFANPQSQIDKSNKDFAEYEAAFGTPDNPNLNNLAPGLKPLSQEQQQTIFDKFNAQQYQAQDDKFLADPYAVQQSIQQTPARDRTTEEMNFLTQNYNAIRPQQERYTANADRQPLYNPTTNLSSMVTGTDQAMNRAASNAIQNAYSNLYGQSNPGQSNQALQNYMNYIVEQDKQREAERQKLIEGYNQARQADIKQNFINELSNAYDRYNYDRSLVFIPSGFASGQSQTFTPIHLASAPGEQKQATNVQDYLKNLQVQQQLNATYAPKAQEQLAQVNQAMALGQSLGIDPMVFMGNTDLSKAVLSDIMKPQVENSAELRGSLGKLPATTYGKMLEKASEQVGQAELDKLGISGDLAKVDTEQSNELRKAILNNMSLMDRAYLDNATKIATQGMQNQNALDQLRLKGFSDIQLAQLKADLESNDPIKQMNAAAQFINAMTNTATPQEAANYQNMFFPGGVPQFSGSPRQ